MKVPPASLRVGDNYGSQRGLGLIGFSRISILIFES